MSAPPPPIGTMVSTPEDPWRPLQVSGQTVRYAGVIANLTGQPAMSVPLWWNRDGLPIGVHFLGRFGDEASCSVWRPSWKRRSPGSADCRPSTPQARPRLQGDPDCLPAWHPGKLVSDLQQLGYLKRRPDGTNKRAKLIFPTRGGQALDDLGKRVAQLEEHWARIVGPERFAACRTLQELLDTLTTGNDRA